MPVATLADYLDKMTRVRPEQFYKSFLIARNKQSSAWNAASGAGGIPSTAVVCDNTFAGALNFESVIGSTGEDFVLARASANVTTGGHVIVLGDRLSHQGGLSGTVTGAQTTNLPTAALTRYTSGVGVMAALEIYTAVGTTATTATGSYTNQDGTSGRTFKEIVFGSATVNNAGLLLNLPLQDGDTGVRSVESITLAASTVSAAGNFGVTLWKPLTMIHPTLVGTEAYGVNSFNALIGGAGQFSKVEENACLFLVSGNSAAAITTGNLSFMRI